MHADIPVLSSNNGSAEVGYQLMESMSGRHRPAGFGVARCTSFKSFSIRPCMPGFRGHLSPADIGMPTNRRRSRMFSTTGSSAFARFSIVAASHAPMLVE